MVKVQEWKGIVETVDSEAAEKVKCFPHCEAVRSDKRTT